MSEVRKSVGRVKGVWRYPVKSMLGERCPQVTLDARGIAGDRLYAIRDERGKFGSGKDTERFRFMDGLLGFHARYDGEVPVIRFPDGTERRGDDPATAVALSDALGLAVSVAREEAVSHFDASPVHVLTTASLRWLAAEVGDEEVDVRRFRPNLLVDVDGATDVERAWAGKIVSIGDEVKLRIDRPAVRCRMTDMRQDGLARHGRILKCLGAKADAEFGAYAEIVSAGVVRVDDALRFADA